jgi:hypothetical protein
MWAAILVVAGLVLLAGAAGALPGQWAQQAPASQDPAAPQDVQATVAEKISYQGQLTDPGGTPLDGTFPMRFQVWGAAVGGVMFWDTGVVNVDVDRGLFNVEIELPQQIFDGRELWLEIWVDGDWLSPRQELVPVPYALSLRPGARIEADTQYGYGVEVYWPNALATGGAIRAESATSLAIMGYSPGGYGVYGYSENNYAVYGYDGGYSPDHGYGGYFNSANGIGLYGHTSATTSGQNPHAPGVFGESENGVGVYGASHGPLPAIRGIGWDDGDGVEGASYNSLGAGVHGMTRNAGAGVWGDSDWIAVYAESISSYGIYASTGLGTNDFGLYTPDNIYSLNYNLAGSIMHVVQNGGEQALEPGDVVVFSGMAAPLEEGAPPVIQVARAASANSTAVAGVVYRRFDAQALQARPQPEQPDGGLPAEVTPDGPVPAGEYLLLVVEGPAQVKASALAGAIQPGDLVSSAGEMGHAARIVDAALPGTVLGKALEPLAAGQQLIYIFVTLQ